MLQREAVVSSERLGLFGDINLEVQEFTTCRDGSHLAVKGRTVNETSWARRPDETNDLTDLQKSILDEAFDSSSLIAILNWCTPQIDGGFWNRKWKYVPEVSSASLVLLRWGFIEVVLDGHPTTRAVAEALLKEPSNWWSFDPDDHTDENELRKLMAAGVLGYREPPAITMEGTQEARRFATQ